MKKFRVGVAAIAAACMMGTGAASASAAITVGGPGAWASTITLPNPSGFSFNVAGGWFSCGAQVVSNITSTGAATVSAFNETSCPGTFTFHTPFSGQIVGSPGNYKLQIPVSFTYKQAQNLWTCEHSGTVSLPLTSGSTVVGAPTSTSLTAPVTASCPAGASTMVISGTGGTNSSARTITGTL